MASRRDEGLDRRAGPQPRLRHTCPVRVFVAVDLPGPTMQLLQLLSRPARRGIQWTTPARWHITLRFLGEVDDPGAVAEALSCLGSGWRGGAVEAALGTTTAWFPSGRVLHVPVAGLDALAGAVRDATSRWRQLGEPTFLGHVTLARFRGRGAAPEDLAGASAAARFKVREVVLYESPPGSRGALYRAFSRVPLIERRR